MDGVNPSKRYVISKCSKCQNILVLDVRTKRRKCPRCGQLVTTKTMLSARRFTAREASEIAKALKMKQRH